MGRRRRLRCVKTLSLPHPEESMMKRFPRRPVLFLAMALSIAALASCADVRPAPAGSVVDGQAAPPAAQVADVPPPRQSSVPF